MVMIDFGKEEVDSEVIIFWYLFNDRMKRTCWKVFLRTKRIWPSMIWFSKSKASKPIITNRSTRNQKYIWWSCSFSFTIVWTSSTSYLLSSI